MKTTHQLKPERSLQFAAWIVLAACIAAIAILNTSLDTVQRTFALLLLISMSLYSIWNDGFGLPEHRIAAIYWSEEQKSGDSWVIELANGQQIPVALSESQSSLSGRMVTLVFIWRDESAYFARRKLSAMLLPDSASHEQLRLLRLALNSLH